MQLWLVLSKNNVNLNCLKLNPVVVDFERKYLLKQEPKFCRVILSWLSLKVNSAVKCARNVSLWRTAYNVVLLVNMSIIVIVTARKDPGRPTTWMQVSGGKISRQKLLITFDLWQFCWKAESTSCMVKDLTSNKHGTILFNVCQEERVPFFMSFITFTKGEITASGVVISGQLLLPQH